MCCRSFPLLRNVFLGVQVPSHEHLKYLNDGAINDVLRAPGIQVNGLPIHHDKSAQRWKNVSCHHAPSLLPLACPGIRCTAAPCMQPPRPCKQPVTSCADPARTPDNQAGRGWTPPQQGEPTRYVLLKVTLAFLNWRLDKDGARLQLDPDKGRACLLSLQRAGQRLTLTQARLRPPRGNLQATFSLATAVFLKAKA